MSLTIRANWKVDDVLTTATSVVLEDATSTYGVKRNDNDAVVVAAGTAMTEVSTGVYEYTFDPPASDLTYTYCPKVVYNGATYGPFELVYDDSARVVSVTEAKEHLYITDDEQDTLIGRLIDTATSWCEKYQCRKYLTQTCVDYMDGWPKVMRPVWSPLVAVTSIQYIDENGTTQTWDSTLYDVDIATEPGRIVPAYNETYPNIRGDINSIILTYTAGYGDSGSDVPEEIRNAILLLVGHWFEHREEVIDGASPAQIPMGIKALLGLDKMIRI